MQEFLGTLAQLNQQQWLGVSLPKDGLSRVYSEGIFVIHLVIHLSSFVSAVLSILNFKSLFYLANLVMELGSLLQEELWRWDSQGFGNSNPIPQEDGPGFCSRGICSNIFICSNNMF
jgi:hypothetical protein